MFFLDWLFDRLDWPDVFFLASGFAWGVVGTLIWFCFDDMEMWKGPVKFLSIVFWSGFGIMLLVGAIRQKMIDKEVVIKKK